MRALLAQAALKHQPGYQGSWNHQPTQHFLAGYVISRETSVRLGCVIDSLNPDSFPPLKGEFYWFPNAFEDALRKDLPFQGEDSIAVHWIGETSNFDTIFATHKSYDYKGPPVPKVVEGEKEEDLRKWLKKKGNVLSSLCPPYTMFLTPSTGVSPSEYQWRVIVEDIEP